MLRNDSWIKEQADNMIAPFVDHQVREIDGKRVISYGLSSFGYDIRLANEFLLFQPEGLIDPKEAFHTVPIKGREGYIILQAHTTILSRSMEYMHIPYDTQAMILGKSTWARVGLLVNATPLEPGWHGYITLELSNLNPYPIKLWYEEGIAQVIFFSGELPEVTYASRNGKYQGQLETTPSRV